MLVYSLKGEKGLCWNERTSSMINCFFTLLAFFPQIPVVQAYEEKTRWIMLREREEKNTYKMSYISKEEVKVKGWRWYGERS